MPGRATRATHRLCTLGAGAVLAFLGVTGVLKLLDVPAFHTSVISWGIPEKIALVIAFVLPLGEILLLLAWCDRRHRRNAEIAALGLLAAFAVVLSVGLLAGRAPPNCGCLGLLERHAAWLSGTKFAIVRALALLALLATALIARPLIRGQVGSGSTSRIAAARGFTLLEMMLTISCIALLIALLSPSLHRVRAGAMQTKTLTNLRSSAGILTQYTTDWREAFHAFTDPRATTTILRLADGRAVSIEIYFISGQLWTWALADRYLDSNPFPSFVFDAETWARTGGPGGSPFFMPCTYFAAPEYWNPSTRTGPAQFRGVRVHEVVFPSGKSLLVNPAPFVAAPSARTLIPLAFADGRASAPPLAEIPAGYERGDGSSIPPALHLYDFYAAMHTIDGVRGRDLR